MKNGDKLSLLRRSLSVVRRGVMETIQRRECPLAAVGPIVSFTFDDFPRSALTVGGSILKYCGASGTYYAALGLLNKVTDLGEHFGMEDLERLLNCGHELGSHTLKHTSCRATRLSDFLNDMKKGKQAIEEITGVQKEHHFSYPYGHATLLAKRKVGATVSSCRGNTPGINKAPVDLNLLRANSLYSWCLDLESIDRLLKVNQKSRGWLIFYTHDISENPSPYGCKPREFENVVNLALKSNATILPIGKAIAGC